MIHRILIAALLIALGCAFIFARRGTTPNDVCYVADLVELSKLRQLADRPAPWDRSKGSESEFKLAAAYIVAQPDYTSYHLLITLSIESPTRYAQIPPAVVAKVLASAMQHVQAMNDFASPAPQPSGTDYGVSGNLLVSTGRSAIPALIPVLDDISPAEVYGSEAATES